MSPVSHRSFRNKVLRTILSSMFIMLGVTGLGLVAIESWINEKKLHQDMQVLADILGNRSRAALEFGDTNAGQLNLSAAKYQKYVDAVCLYDQSGALFSAYSRAGAAYDCSTELAGARIQHVALQQAGGMIEHEKSLGLFAYHAGGHREIPLH
mgnify:CR=1 FL=1